MEEKGSREFSFSGLKSAVLNYLNGARQRGEEIRPADVAASFQQSVIDVLAAKSLEAVEDLGLDTLVLAGGVAANSSLEALLRARCAERGIRFCYPSPVLCTDNAAMIGCRGYYQALAGGYADEYLDAEPRLGLSDVG